MSPRIQMHKATSILAMEAIANKMQSEENILGLLLDW